MYPAHVFSHSSWFFKQKTIILEKCSPPNLCSFWCNPWHPHTRRVWVSWTFRQQTFNHQITDITLGIARRFSRGNPAKVGPFRLVYIIYLLCVYIYIYYIFYTCIWMSFLFCLLYIYNSMIVHVNFTSNYIVKCPGLNTVANNRCLLFIYTNVLHYPPTITCIIYYPPILYNSRFMKHERQQNTILGFPGIISTTEGRFLLCMLILPGWRRRRIWSWSLLNTKVSEHMWTNEFTALSS